MATFVTSATTRRLILTAAVLGALLVSPPLAQDVQAAPAEYGSIAYARAERVVGIGVGADQNSAQAAAERDCRRQGGNADCQAVAWFRNASAAFAMGAGGKWGWGWGDTAGTADSFALESCLRWTSGCTVVKRLATAAGSEVTGGDSSPLRGNWRAIGPGPGGGAHRSEDHFAVDLISDDLAVYPARTGRIIHSRNNCASEVSSCYGHVIAIDHGNGIYSIYAHLAGSNRAMEGRQVKPTDRIGTMSNSGCSGCIQHLHYAMRSNPNARTVAQKLHEGEPLQIPWRAGG